MRSESDIRHKLKQVRYRHRKKRVRKGMARHPENCLWNEENQSLTGCPRFCIHRERSAFLCDSRYGGELVVAECPLFEPASTVEEIKQEFDEFIETASKEELAQEMPDLMALLWTLGDDPEKIEVSDDTDEEDPDKGRLVEMMNVVDEYIPTPPRASEKPFLMPVEEGPLVHLDDDDIVYRPWYARLLKFFFPRWVK